MPFGNTPEESVKKAEQLLISRGLLRKGEQLIVMSDMIEGEEKFDSIQLRTI
jgi:pyruvate kinase